jgi:hypothetical protein
MAESKTICRTFKELVTNHDWDKVCEVTGLNPWCMNEGLADKDDIQWFTESQAKECGII